MLTLALERRQGLPPGLLPYRIAIVVFGAHAQPCGDEMIRKDAPGNDFPHRQKPAPLSAGTKPERRSPASSIPSGAARTSLQACHGLPFQQGPRPRRPVGKEHPGGSSRNPINEDDAHPTTGRDVTLAVSMPDDGGGSCTAAFNSSCCYWSKAEGNHRSAQIHLSDPHQQPLAIPGIT